MNAPLAGPVLVVGTGLVGTSIALALRAQGVEVLLEDRDPQHVRTAHQLDAGRPLVEGDRPQVVVVAVPPDHLGATIADALGRFEDASVTDVGSVKVAPLAYVAAKVPAEWLARYVGSHPMAGSERSGPLAATHTLFEGRPWAVTPHESADLAAIELVTAVAELAGAAVVMLRPEEHDAAVARISHLPHLMSVLVAGRLASAPADELALAGQGVRDVTRIAASDPTLWRQIVAANAVPVLCLLRELREDLDALMQAVENGSTDALTQLLVQGVSGTQQIPGKHGGPTRESATVFVSIPDQPGALARLFADAGESGVNIEDVRIDHDPGRDTGLVELGVEASYAKTLLDALESKGWVTHR
ncbi:MAG: prephenate dehydrogenase [Nocardioides sp.]